MSGDIDHVTKPARRAAEVVAALRERAETLAAVESVTGGLLAATIVTAARYGAGIVTLSPHRFPHESLAASFLSVVAAGVLAAALAVFFTRRGR